MKKGAPTKYDDSELHRITAELVIWNGMKRDPAYREAAGRLYPNGEQVEAAVVRLRKSYPPVAASLERTAKARKDAITKQPLGWPPPGPDLGSLLGSPLPKEMRLGSDLLRLSEQIADLALAFMEPPPNGTSQAAVERKREAARKMVAATERALADIWLWE